MNTSSSPTFSSPVLPPTALLEGQAVEDKDGRKSHYDIQQRQRNLPFIHVCSTSQGTLQVINVCVVVHQCV